MRNTLAILTCFSSIILFVYSAPKAFVENEDFDDDDGPVEGIDKDYEPKFFRVLNPGQVKKREKRQLMELISGLASGGGGGGGGGGGEGEEGGGGGGSSIANLIPGFSEYGPAFMSLINNFLGFMKCCGPLNIPDVVNKLVMKCSDDLTNKFFNDAGFMNKTEEEKKITIFLRSPSLSGFFEAEFCTIKCAFGRMKMLTAEGLPNPTTMKKVVPKMLKGQGSLLDPSLAECEKAYQEEYGAWKTSKKALSDSDRCWASTAFIECMYRQVVQVCPEEQVQAGSLCLQKMGTYFWGEMPKQVGKFFSVIKGMVDIL